MLVTNVHGRFQIHHQSSTVCQNHGHVANGKSDEEAIDREYAAEKSAEDALDVDSEDDNSPNLDDPEVVGNFMDDFQA